MATDRRWTVRSLCVAALLTGASMLQAATAESLTDLSRQTHFHGIAYAATGDASTLLIATHHGMFAIEPNGEARRLSPVHDFMGFTADPSDPGRLLGSGHPKEGGNSGFLESRDGGATWSKVADGAGGPVDFHALTVSRADPRVLYGAYRGIQRSEDGGTNWQVSGPLPPKLISLAASASNADRIFAATAEGLLVSEDRGASFRTAGFKGETVSAVAVDSNGKVYVFVLGRGLMRTQEGKASDWELINASFGESIPLHIAFHPAEPDRVALATQANEVLESLDGGRTWRPFDKRP